MEDPRSPLICACIDTGKGKRDGAFDHRPGGLQVNNDRDGHAALAAHLDAHAVQRGGANGGYERIIVADLRAQGFEVLEPKQVRAYANFRRQRAKYFGKAKNDKIDASLIAACTAAVETLHAPSDARCDALSDDPEMEYALADAAIVKVGRHKQGAKGGQKARP